MSKKFTLEYISIINCLDLNTSACGRFIYLKSVQHILSCSVIYFLSCIALNLMLLTKFLLFFVLSAIVDESITTSTGTRVYLQLTFFLNHRTSELNWKHLSEII